MESLEDQNKIKKLGI